MEVVIWIAILGAAIAVMVGGADVFLKNAELLGLRMGLSAFTIGVIIVGFGTSLPELTSSLVAVFANAHSIIVANAIGSNIANILLVGGLIAFVGKRLKIGRNLLDAELPFFVISTLLFAEVAYDAQVTLIESLLLVSTFVVYMVYLFKEDYDNNAVVDSIQDEVQRERFRFFHLSETRSLLLLSLGLLGLLFGAKYVVEAVIELATLLTIPPSVISITAIALGTSLPEMVVSIKALRQDKLSVAIGNIFGSNAFNLLVAVGIPGLFTVLPLDTPTFSIGLPILLVSSFIFVVIGLAHRLYRWEGIMFFLLYAFFVLQLITLL